MIDLLVSILTFVLVALVSGNNLAVCSGSIISGRMVSKNLGIAIAAAGYVAGLLLQGNLLQRGIASIIPLSSPGIISIALLVSTIVFVIGYIARVPQSLSITFTMALVGISLALHAMISGLFIGAVVLFWIVAPLAAAALTIVLQRAATRATRKARIWKTLGRVKLALIAISFLSALALGANTLGLLYVSVNPYTGIWVILAGIVVGSFFLSSGPLKRLGDQIMPIRYINALVAQGISSILVEVATIGSVPFSNSQAFTASLYGAALSYKTKILMRKNVIVIVLVWTATALAGLALGYVLAAA